MPLLSRIFRTLENTCGADPLVRGRRPRRPVGLAPNFDSRCGSGSRGTRADQGVRPTAWGNTHSDPREER
jgi:hypothetical protein